MSGISAGMSLAELPIGAKAAIVGVNSKSGNMKRLADVGLVPGAELSVEAHAPFGSLIRVRIMDASMALHKDEASCIMIKVREAVNA